MEAMVTLVPFESNVQQNDKFFYECSLRKTLYIIPYRQKPDVCKL